MRQYRNYTDEDICRYSKEVKSLAGLLRQLGLIPRGGNYGTIKKHLQRLQIDTAHWTGQGWLKDQRCKAWEQYSRRGSVKKQLIRELGESCQNCGITHWCGKTITLELEHIDGDPTNHARENITLLCPNCHSQTDTWKGRKNKK